VLSWRSAAEIAPAGRLSRAEYRPAPLDDAGHADGIEAVVWVLPVPFSSRAREEKVGGARSGAGARGGSGWLARSEAASHTNAWAPWAEIQWPQSVAQHPKALRLLRLLRALYTPQSSPPPSPPNRDRPPSDARDAGNAGEAGGGVAPLDGAMQGMQGMQGQGTRMEASSECGGVTALCVEAGAGWLDAIDDVVWVLARINYISVLYYYYIFVVVPLHMCRHTTYILLWH
jgi:hypothetical protein